MVDLSDWDSAEDAVYDGPDAEQQAAYAKRKAMREYMELSQRIEDELVAEMGQEEYDASQHWINNSLIKPRSKVAMFKEWEARIRKEENEHSIKLLDEFIENCDLPEVVDRLEWFKDALIKGEK